MHIIIYTQKTAIRIKENMRVKLKNILLIHLTCSFKETGLCEVTSNDVSKMAPGLSGRVYETDPSNDAEHKRRDATKRRCFYLMLSYVVI